MDKTKNPNKIGKLPAYDNNNYIIWVPMIVNINDVL